MPAFASGKCFWFCLARQGAHTCRSHRKKLLRELKGETSKDELTGSDQNQKSRQLFFVDLVAIAKRPEPDPIPNSTVKRFSANGTKPQGLGESVAAKSAKNSCVSS